MKLVKFKWNIIYESIVYSVINQTCKPRKKWIETQQLMGQTFKTSCFYSRKERLCVAEEQEQVVNKVSFKSEK